MEKHTEAALLYPSNALEQLEFDQIQNKLATYCQSEAARERVYALYPSKDVIAIQESLRKVSEYAQSLQGADRWPELQVPEILDFLPKCRIEGHYFHEMEWLSLKKLLRSAFQVADFLSRKKENLPRLSQMAASLTLHRNLFVSIDKALDDEGQVRPNASRILSQIDDSLRMARTQARKRIESVYRKAKESEWTGDGQISIREGRLVIPLLAEHKRKIKGFIQDESATGQTVYLEPAEVLEMNNEIRDLELSWKREVRKLLQELTASFRPFESDIHAYYDFLAEIDFIRAKVLLADRYEGTVPEVQATSSLLHWKSRHPLLVMHYRDLKKPITQVIPFRLELQQKQRILLISGPNAGGKSITLKAIGLIQVMAQCGLPVPFDASGVLPVFHRFFVDIGDQQSIENDLSTYSSHLTHMKHFCEESDPKSLFLIDEFGTGTDPQIGGPIAEAILEKLVLGGGWGVINTHFSNLKAFASRTEGVLNAAMTFDTATLQPRFELVIGQPGSSYALEIAQKIGLDPSILSSAREKIGQRTQNVEELILELENEKTKTAERKSLIEQKDVLLDELIKRNQLAENELKAKKNEILKKARQEAQELLLKANKEIESAVRSIKASKADKEVVQLAREQVKQLQTEVQSQTQIEVVLPTSPEEIKVGSKVKLKDSSTTGTVVGIEKNKALLENGAIKMKVAIESLELISGKEARKIERKQVGNSGQMLMEQQQSFTPQLDLRGFRTQDAIAELERFLDKAVVSGYGQLRILHGKGDGILRKFVRENLKQTSWVKSFESEHADRGGDGITLVTMR